MTKSFWKTALAMFLFPLSLVGSLGILVALFFITLPDVVSMKGCLTTTMYEVYLCPESSHYVKLSQISAVLLDSVVASEDAGFFQHQGFDWYEIKESMDQNLKSGEFKRGGSTLTQQLAKNVFLSKEKSLFRKLREAALTFEIERYFSKKEILEKYLNVVEFGPHLYGIKDAAQYYFQKSPAQLHVLEAVFLAFLLPNPKGYHKNFVVKKLTPFAAKTLTILVRRLVSFKKISPTLGEGALAHLDEFPWTFLTSQSFEDTGSVSSTVDLSSPTDDQINKVFEEERKLQESESWTPSDDFPPTNVESPLDESEDSDG